MHYRSLSLGGSLALLVTFFVIFSLSIASDFTHLWELISNHLPSDIQTLAAAPTTIYAGSWGQGVYRSDDHGATWITATAGLTLPIYVKGGLAVNPVAGAPPAGRPGCGESSTRSII